MSQNPPGRWKIDFSNGLSDFLHLLDFFRKCWVPKCRSRRDLQDYGTEFKTKKNKQTKKTHRNEHRTYREFCPGGILPGSLSRTQKEVDMGRIAVTCKTNRQM